LIIENNGIEGKKSDLAHLDRATEQLGFVRWQWEYYRATYDLKLEDKASGEDFFLRVNTRATSGKLESPEAELVVEHIYVGRATFPHGLDYTSPIPEAILQQCNQKLADLKKLLAE
jgi:hypothetical protein